MQPTYKKIKNRKKCYNLNNPTKKTYKKLAKIKKITYLCKANKKIATPKPKTKGVVLEWLKRHAWKACIRQKRIPSSNLGHSAK